MFSEMVHMKQLSVRCTHKEWQKYFCVDPHTISFKRFLKVQCAGG